MPDRPRKNPIKSRNRVLGKSNPFPSLPEGGKTGEVLVKTSDETGEVEWGVVQGDGSVTPPFDPTYLEEKDKEQDDRLDAIEASPPPPPFDDSALKLKDSQQDDRMDALEAEDQSQDARISDLEKIDPFDPTALIEKDEEQDDRLDALEAAPPGGGGSYDDTAIWESQAEQDERLDLLEQMGGDADLWGTYKCQSSSSAPMAGQIRALPLDDKVVNIEWFFIHNETLNGNGLPLDQIDPGEHIRLTSPAGLVVDFTVTDVEDRTTYQKITVDKAATICSDPDSEWSVYWVGQSQVVFSLKQSAQGGGGTDYDDSWLDGGSAGQVLTKSSGTDKDVYWATPSSGGGGGGSGVIRFPDFKITREYLYRHVYNDRYGHWNHPDWGPGVMMHIGHSFDPDPAPHDWKKERGFCHPLDADGNEEPAFQWILNLRLAMYDLNKSADALAGYADPLISVSYYIHNETQNAVYYSGDYFTNRRISVTSHDPFSFDINRPGGGYGDRDAGWWWPEGGNGWNVEYHSSIVLNDGDIITVGTYDIMNPPVFPGAISGPR